MTLWDYLKAGYFTFLNFSFEIYHWPEITMVFCEPVIYQKLYSELLSQSKRWKVISKKKYRILSERAVYITMREKFSAWIWFFCNWTEKRAQEQLRLVWQIYLHICILALNRRSEMMSIFHADINIQKTFFFNKFRGKLGRIKTNRKKFCANKNQQNIKEPKDVPTIVWSKEYWLKTLTFQEWTWMILFVEIASEASFILWQH